MFPFLAPCQINRFVATFCNRVFVTQDRHTIVAHAPHLTLPLICPALKQAGMLNVCVHLYALMFAMMLFMYYVCVHEK